MAVGAAAPRLEKETVSVAPTAGRKKTLNGVGSVVVVPVRTIRTNGGGPPGTVSLRLGGFFFGGAAFFLAAGAFAPVGFFLAIQQVSQSSDRSRTAQRGGGNGSYDTR